MAAMSRSPIDSIGGTVCIACESAPAMRSVPPVVRTASLTGIRAPEQHDHRPLDRLVASCMVMTRRTRRQHRGTEERHRHRHEWSATSAMAPASNPRSGCSCGGCGRAPACARERQQAEFGEHVRQPLGLARKTTTSPARRRTLPMRRVIAAPERLTARSAVP